MAVRDVPMSGTVDVDELPDDRDEVDTETFAKRMMKPEPTKPLSVDQTHYTAKSDWSTKQRDADIDDALAARGYALADLDENGEPRGREDDDASMRASRKPSKAEKAAEKAKARRTRVAGARDASGKKWFSDQFIRNASIFAGACLGATYEVARMPATVQNFNKAVYATTGYVAESLPKNGLAGKALSHIDFYAMVLDVLSAVAYFAAIVGVAIACVVVVVRMIGIFTGMGESALNFVCIPFTWTYAKRFVDECVARASLADVRVAPTATQRLGASLGVTAIVVEAFETVAPVTTRGMCLGLAFSFFATEMMQFASGFVWIVGLLVATWVARVALRLVLGVVSKVFPPMERLRDAMPAVHVVPGLRKAAEHLGVGAGAALKAGSAAAKAAGAGAARSAKAARKAGSLAKDGVSVGGGAGAAAAVAGAKVGAAVGAAAAKTTVYGFLAGAKGGVRAGLAAGNLALRGTAAAGSALIGAPTFAWRSAGKVRAFVRLAAVQAEVFVDPVAPRARRATREGKIGQGAGGAAVRTQKLRL